jgi:uncharacterized membrane protein
MSLILLLNIKTLLMTLAGALIDQELIHLIRMDNLGQANMTLEITISQAMYPLLIPYPRQRIKTQQVIHQVPVITKFQLSSQMFQLTTTQLRMMNLDGFDYFKTLY